MKIWAKTKEYFEGKFLVVRRDGSVPHWPHFVLGARDPCAAMTLRYYCNQCVAHKYDREYIESIFELANDFDKYRKTEGNGDPEAAPHRVDNPDVISAMRGNKSTITVEQDKENKSKF